MSQKERDVAASPQRAARLLQARRRIWLSLMDIIFTVSTM